MPVSNDPPAMTAPFPDSATLAELTVAKTPGVASPVVIRQVTPSYTAETMRAKIQGETTLQVVVRADGIVEHVRVAKSLHPALDRQAQIAAAYWLFTPPTRNGQPVPVVAELIMSFNLH